MLKIAALIWIMLATVLAGAVMTAIVSVPKLYDQAEFLIPVFCGAAIVVAMPIAYMIARQISAPLAR